MKIRKNTISIIPSKSFHEWKGWKGILSILELVPNGFDDPDWWRKTRCIITTAAVKNGSRKCKVKNRVKVALSTANPPQTHCTVSWPIYGIADKRLVITVAPQKDICPHGRTYPIKAVPITNIIKVTPIVHVCVKE